MRVYSSLLPVMLGAVVRAGAPQDVDTATHVEYSSPELRASCAETGIGEDDTPGDHPDDVVSQLQVGVETRTAAMMHRQFAVPEKIQLLPEKAWDNELLFFALNTFAATAMNASKCCCTTCCPHQTVMIVCAVITSLVIFVCYFSLLFSATGLRDLGLSKS